jgi:aldose 1-epimerase
VRPGEYDPGRGVRRRRQGKYTFESVDCGVPVNEPERACALHGFAFDTEWILESRGQSSVELSCAKTADPATFPNHGASATLGR